MILVVVFVKGRFDSRKWVDEVWMPDLATMLEAVKHK